MLILQNADMLFLYESLQVYMKDIYEMHIDYKDTTSSQILKENF